MSLGDAWIAVVRSCSILDDSQWERSSSAARNLALAAHMGACRETSGNGYSGPWSYCGNDFQTGRRGVHIPLDTIWYCDEAREIQALGGPKQ
jgi:hypothetical protein